MFSFSKSKSDFSIDKAKDAVAEKKGIFLDVREKFEVEQGYIEGCLWIALGDIVNDPHNIVEKLKSQFKDYEFYVYCGSGKRSGMAEKVLKGHGIKAHNVGGFSDLTSEDLAVATGIPRTL